MLFGHPAARVAVGHALHAARDQYPVPDHTATLRQARRDDRPAVQTYSPWYSASFTCGPQVGAPSVIDR
jgi:hypothetical protein